MLWSLFACTMQADSDLAVSEILPRNQSWPHAPADLVELVNEGARRIELSRVGLADASGKQWSGEPGTFLEPGEFLVLKADDEQLPFKLDADGDGLVLTLDQRPVDELAWKDLAGDVALARFEDGWHATVPATPGAANVRGDPDPSRTLFDTVVDIRITLDLDAEEALHVAPYDRVAAGLSVQGIDVGKVAVRLKGGRGSFRLLSDKPAFKVDLNRFAKKKRVRGLEALTLNNLVQDPSCLREHFAYRAFRAAGLPAPRTGFARVFVNGVDKGLYLHVETIDDTFLRRWYGDQAGALYEAAPGTDFVAGHERRFEYDEGPDPRDRKAITRTIEALDNATSLDGPVDLDHFVEQQAMAEVVGHHDGYRTRGRYRLWSGSDGLQIIPWGADESWAPPPTDAKSETGRLLQACLDDTACAARYDAARTEARAVVASLDLHTEAERLRGILGPIAPATFDRGVDDLISRIAASMKSP